MPSPSTDSIHDLDIIDSAGFVPLEKKNNKKVSTTSNRTIDIIGFHTIAFLLFISIIHPSLFIKATKCLCDSHHKGPERDTVIPCILVTRDFPVPVASSPKPI